MSKTDVTAEFIDPPFIKADRLSKSRTPHESERSIEMNIVSKDCLAALYLYDAKSQSTQCFTDISQAEGDTQQ